MNWKSVNQDTPIAYEKGEWDGLRSARVLVMLNCGIPVVARLYSGVLDGSVFHDWYDDNDFPLDHVTHWMNIPEL